MVVDGIFIFIFWNVEAIVVFFYFILLFYYFIILLFYCFIVLLFLGKLARVREVCP